MALPKEQLNDDFTFSPSTWKPKVITSLEESGLNLGFVSDQALKLLYFHGELTGLQIAELMHLPFQGVMVGVMEFLKREQMVEVKGAGGVNPAAYRYTVTNKGSIRAREQLERTTYIGPAPVTWDDYINAIMAQSAKDIKVTAAVMRRALAGMVLDQRLFDKIGPAVNSGKSIFLYGPPGNGKSTIAENIGRTVLGAEMYLPYAVIVDGQIIKVYDEISHQLVKQKEGPAVTSPLSQPDVRWIKIRRPAIMVGGELTLDGLELRYDPINKYYEAPFQMKANGGMFLIDDFGRQQVRPEDLLNRWIVPMEKRVDFLALHTGRKIEMPFELMLVFSTNLPPADLVDEAFLRRIRHKIEVTSPSFELYWKIFQQVARNRNIPVSEDAVKYLLQEHYVKKKRPLRANHPRDLLDQLMDIAIYRQEEPRITKEMIDLAAESYFVDLY